MSSVFGEPGYAPLPDGRRLHHVSQGEGRPVVVLESGLGASRVEWGLVMPALAERTRVVAYDRAGLGRSDRDPHRRDLERMVEDLGHLLDHLGEDRYVLAGHSLGGPIIRSYAAAHPERVAGLVLVDQAAEDLDIYYRKDVRAMTLGVQSVMAGLAALGVRVVPAELRRILALFPPDMRAEALAEMTRPSEFRATLAEYAALAEGFARLRSSQAALPPVPVTAISGALSPSKVESRVRPDLVASHRRLVEAHPHGRHVLAERSGHMVPQDEPGVVVAEILRIVAGPV
ncbi:alpha/beta fold hydrolase [Streptosporangium carneum]|uniref:Hydrolase or acyltransferase of alpha/beta superfamily protein n=1 Tax=Streptosporangium carneum TaxID=47481 RepID=A0A9W6I6Y4_9ACTN|nr:alpha/beta hydrolase [Streptosporangium carneum]GLK12308.1 hydrolase or acyltransferase of alpha/beta superfamily protein [Streptosporangium carneum]